MKRVFIFFSILILFPILICSQVPKTISYQGLLTDSDGNIVPDGNYNLLFRIYDVSSGGSPLWEEGKLIPVSDGVFNTNLGDAAALNLPFDEAYYLEIKIGADPVLSPRVPLASSAYSFTSMNVSNSAITSEKLADNSVITGKIADGAITQAKLAPSVVLAPGGTAGGDLSGTYPNPVVANEVIKSTQILNGTILNEDINASALIAASKIFGDAGIEYATLGSVSGVTTTISSMGSVTITTPTDGYLFAMFTGHAVFFGDNTTLNFGLSTAPTTFGLVTNSCGRLDGTGTERYDQSFTAIWAGTCVAGNTNIYANVQKSTVFNASAINVSESQLVVLFIPKRY